MSAIRSNKRRFPLANNYAKSRRSKSFLMQGEQLEIRRVLTTAADVVSAGELAGLEQLYAVDDDQFDFNDAYTVDNSASIAAGSFDRVAYFVELGNEWVWVSMDTFNTDPTLLGIPQQNSNIVENGTRVSNLNIETNHPNVTAATGQEGIIEFWASNYNADGGGQFGSNDGLYDWKDSGGDTNSNGHGSFQVFAFNDASLTSANTLFGITRNGGSGIGDQYGPGGGDSPDWTFGPGTDTYAIRNVEIYVGNANAAPVISDLEGDTLSYVPGTDGAQVIDQGTTATVTDPPPPGASGFDGGNLTVSISAGGVPADDQLAILSEGAAAGEIEVAGGTVSYEGTAIGTATGGTGGTDLVITFNADATIDAVSALIDNITYENANATTSPGSRVASFTVTDGDAAASEVSNVTIAMNLGGAVDTFIWDGSGDGVSFGDANNFVSDTVVPDSNDIVIFRDDDPGIVDLGGSRFVGEIRFDGTGSFTLENGTLGVETIDQQATATGNNTISAQISATVLTGSVAAGQLTLSNSANTSSLLGGTITVSGGTLSAPTDGANTGLGQADVTLSGGTLDLQPGVIGLNDGLDQTIFDNTIDNAQDNIEAFRTAAQAIGPSDGQGVLTGHLDFNNDGDVSTRAAALGATGFDNGNFAMLFTTSFTPDEDGAWGFRTSGVDDNLSFWVDTTGTTGTFDATDRFYNRGCCGGSGDQFTPALTAGQSYLLGFVMTDGGGGGYLRDMEVMSPTAAGATGGAWVDLNPSQLPGLFQVQSVANGTVANNINVTADSEINLGSDLPGASFGTLTVAGGTTLTVDSNDGGQTLEFDNVSLQGNATLNTTNDAAATLNNISETTTSNLTTTGNGIVSLPTSNTFSGELLVQGDSTVSLGNSGALGTADGTPTTGTSVSGNGSLQFGAFTISDELLTLGSSGNANSNGGLRLVGGSGNGTINSSIVLSADARISASGGNEFNILGGIDNGGFEVELNANSRIDLEQTGISGAGDVRITGGNEIYFMNNADNTYDGDTIVEDNTRLRIRRDSSLGSSVGDTIVRDQGTVLFEDGDDTHTENFFIEGNGRGNNEGALWNLNANNTINGTVTLTGNATIRSDSGELIIDGQVTGAFTLSKTNLGTLTLTDATNDFANLDPMGGTIRLLEVNALGAAPEIKLDNGETLEYVGDLTVDASANLQSLIVNSGTLAAAGGTTMFDIPITLTGAGDITFGGDGDLNIEQPFGNGNDPASTADALSHFGFHINNDPVALNLNNNGGVMGGGDPRSFPSFFGQALLTDGPGDRGLDFNGDGDFIDTGAIGQNDNYTNLFVGNLSVSEADDGDWAFDFTSIDDQVAFWIDLDQDGIFESDGTLGDNLNEQITYDDGTERTVDLAEGDYLVAFLHREGGGGSQIEMQFTSPTLSKRTIKPSEAEQAGLWSSLELRPDNNVFREGTGTVLLNADNTFNGNVTSDGGTVVANNPGSLGGPTGEVIVNSGGTLALDGGITLSEPLTLNGAGAEGFSGALTNLGGTNTVDGTITVTDANQGTVGIGSEAGELTVESDLDLRFSALALGGAGDLILAGDISNETTPLVTQEFEAYLFTGNDTDLPGDDSQIAFKRDSGEVFFAQEADSLDFWGSDLAGVGNAGNPNDPNNWAATYIADLTIPGTGNIDVQVRHTSADDQNRIRLDLNGNGVFEAGDEDPYGQDRGGTYTSGTISVPRGTPIMVALQMREGGGGSRIQPEITFDGGTSWHRFDTAGIDPAGVNATFTTTFTPVEQVTKTGAGTATLSGDNSGMTGSITISGGTLVADGSVNGSASLGAPGGGITVDDSGALGLANFGDLSTSLDDIAIGNGSLVNVSGDNTISTNVTVLDRSLGTVGIESQEAGSTLTIDSDIELEFSTLEVSGAGDTVINGIVSGDNVEGVEQIPLLDGLTGGENQLYLFGFHDNQESNQDLSGNGGLLSGGDPTTHPDFEGVATFTDGPDGEGLDFDNDAEWRAVDADILDVGGPGIIDQNDNYSTLFYGILNVDAANAGDWMFDIERSDDRAGIWIDLDQNGIFEPTAFGNPGGGNNQNGELIVYEDGSIKTVPLAEGRYLVAFTFHEFGGGSNVDIRVQSPTMAAIEDVNTVSPTQAGYWSTQRPSPLLPNNQLLKSGSGTLTLNGANTFEDGTIVSEGTLLAGNTAGSATGAAAVQVNSPAVLGGTGTIAGPVNVATGASITAGAGIDAGDAAQLTVGDLDATTGVVFGEITATGNDTITVNGTVNVTDAELQLSLVDDFRPANMSEFILIANDGTEAITGTVVDPATGTNLAEGDSFEITHMVGGEVRTRLFTISYTAGTDGNDLAVTLVNRGPVAGDDMFNTLEDTPIDSAPASILDNDSDDDGDTLTITSLAGMSIGSTITLSGGEIDVNADGTFVYTPNSGFAGTETFDYTISDGELTTTATVTIVVDPAANLPTVTVADAGGPDNEKTQVPLTIMLADTDDSETIDVEIAGIPVDNIVSYNDGAPQSFTATAGDTTLTISGMTPALQTTLDTLSIIQVDGPNPAETFDLTVTVTSTESTGDSVTAAPKTITVTIDNAPPAAMIDGPTTTVPSRPVTFTFSANDQNPGDTPFVYDIDWGDGETDTITTTMTSVTLDHSFENFTVGVPTIVSLTVTDSDGESGTDTQAVNIVPVAVIGNDLVAIGSQSSDRIIFSSANGGIQVRYNNVFFGPFSIGAGGQLVAEGQAGNDQIIVAGNLQVEANFDGGMGNDYLAGGTQDDTLIGGAGNDVVLGGEGDNVLIGDNREGSEGDGSDRLEGRSGTDIIFGGGGNDRLNGGDGSDTLDGGDGNDFVFGGLGNDLIHGGSGADTINGSFGNDIILGGSQADQIFGGSDQDLLIGGDGADRLRGDSGDDSLIGGNTPLDADIEAALDALLASGTDFDAGLQASLDDWYNNFDRTDFGTPTSDGATDDLTGGSGVDEFQASGNGIRDFRDGESTF